MGELILIILVLAGLSLLIATCSGIAISLGFAIKAMAPGINRRLLTFVSTGAIPMAWLVFLVAAPMVALDDEFRGPEVLGFAIIFGLAMLFVVIIWPISFFVTCRVFRNR